MDQEQDPFCISADLDTINTKDRVLMPVQYSQYCLVIVASVPIKRIWRISQKNLEIICKIGSTESYFTRPLADLDTEQLLSIISSTLQNWIGLKSHDYFEVQNLNLIMQSLIASNFEGPVL